MTVHPHLKKLFQKEFAFQAENQGRITYVRKLLEDIPMSDLTVSEFRAINRWLGSWECNQPLPSLEDGENLLSNITKEQEK